MKSRLPTDFKPEKSRYYSKIARIAVGALWDCDAAVHDGVELLLAAQHWPVFVFRLRFLTQNKPSALSHMFSPKDAN